MKNKQFKKCLRVIISCKSKKQLVAADRYVVLAHKEAMRKSPKIGFFVGDLYAYKAFHNNHAMAMQMLFRLIRGQYPIQKEEFVKRGRGL